MSTARTPLWTAFAAAAATNGKTSGKWVASGVSIDTRSLEPGDLFIALTGENRDGHEFVADALREGRGRRAGQPAAAWRCLTMHRS